MSNVKFGVNFNVSSNNFSKIKYDVLECEKLGYYSAWIVDHFFYNGGPVFECWTILSALAAITNKIRLGSLVLCNSYRIPSVLAKMTSTLDIISNGRLEFGFGAGWKKDEYLAYGISFPKTSIRIAQMREAVKIIKMMWTEVKPTFNGKYYHIKEAYCEPKPIQKPNPPIWIGGTGEKLLLRAVAELADGYNIYSRDVTGLEECGHKLEVLKKHCKEVGRDYGKIMKSWTGDLIIAKNKEEVRKKLTKLQASYTKYVLKEDGNWVLESIPMESYLKQSIVGTPNECSKQIEKYIELGFTYFMFRQISQKEDRELFAKKIMPSFI